MKIKDIIKHLETRNEAIKSMIKSGDLEISGPYKFNDSSLVVIPVTQKGVEWLKETERKHRKDLVISKSLI
jgi:hypothetical protein